MALLSQGGTQGLGQTYPNSYLAPRTTPTNVLGRAAAPAKKDLKKTKAAPSPSTPTMMPGYDLAGLTMPNFDRAAAPTENPADPNVDYQAAYQAALGESQANIEAQYSAALAELANREGIANQAIDQLPGNLNAIYEPAQASMNQTSQALYQAQQASGLTPFLPQGAEAAPIQAALSGALASRQADVPLLKLSAAGAASQARQSLDQSRMSALSNLSSSGGGGGSDAMALAQQKRQWELEDRANTPSQTQTWGLNEIASDRGGEIAHFSPDLADTVRAGAAGKDSKVYSKVLNDLIKNPPQGKSGNLKANKLLQRIRTYQSKYGGNAAAVSLALFDSGLSSLIPKG